MRATNRTWRIGLVLALIIIAAIAIYLLITGPKDIVETLEEDGSFTRLVAALEAANLVDTLKGDEPFTIFAPTDAAFDKLPAGSEEALLQDPALLTDILNYHIVNGEVLADALDRQEAIATLQGESVTVKVNAGIIKLNNAQVIASDIMAANGVIYKIDTILMSVAPPESPPPTDLKDIEVWLPYPEGEPLPIDDAELVPGHPLMRAGIEQLRAVISPTVQINIARTVRLEEERETTYLAPIGPLATDDIGPIDLLQAPSDIIIGVIVLEGEEIKFEAGAGPYAVRVLVFGENGSLVEMVDSTGEGIATYELDIAVDELDETPSAAIFYGTKYCKVWFRGQRYCFPCGGLGPYNTRAACQSS